MIEFLTVDSIETAREKLLGCAKNWLAGTERLPLPEAHGRVLAGDIYTAMDIPAFRRSTVDGYAALSADTAAAGESIPVFLRVRGRVEMGKAAGFRLSAGECAEVPTGGMLPEGADAVVMAEYAESFGEDHVALCKSAAYGEHAVQPGEDAKAGTLLLSRGRRLLPQDIGALAAAGVAEVPVFRRPRITVLSTGNELIPPQSEPMPGQIRDVNTYALAALAEKTGYITVRTGVLPDNEAALEEAIRKAMYASDIVAVSGGSSKGKKDATRAVIGKISSPGVFTHGIAVKPGKPTILGCDENTRTVLAGLPGHPVSAMIIFELLFGWLFRELTGCAGAPAIPARLSCNMAASEGKLTLQPCRLTMIDTSYVAEPVFGKSGLITSLTRASGCFEIPRGAEGLRAGETVMVTLF
jgi:molybdopterin molybdotransferase